MAPLASQNAEVRDGIMSRDRLGRRSRFLNHAVSPSYRGDIDGLRAVAVVLVVLYHAGVPGFSGGYVGVDVFFVISGFLITSALLRQGESGGVRVREFYAGRIRRLLPQSMMVLVTTVALGLWLLPVSRSDELLLDARAALLWTSNWRFADKSVAYVDTQVSEGMLTHFWSLSIEEQYYLAWPLLIASLVVVTRRLPRIPLRRAAGLLVAITFTGSLTASIVLTPDEGARAYYLTHLRLWEIAAGAIVATFLKARRRANRSAAILASALLAILIAALHYDERTPFPGSAALLPVLATTLLIIFGGGDDVHSRVLGSRPLRYVGERSYALYLWHWPALGVFVLIRERHGWNHPEWVDTCLAILAAAVLSILSYRWIENPIRHSQRLQPLPRLTLGVGVVLTIVFALGIAPIRDRNMMYASEGWADAPVSPAEATEDTASALYGSCHQTVASDFTPFDWCVLGDPDGDVTIALAGDSHAQHWAPAFSAAGAANGWRVLLATRSNCVPYDVPIYSTRVERMDTGCRTWGEVVRVSLADTAVDVFVVGRAAGYLRKLRRDEGLPVDLDTAEEMVAASVTSFAASISEFADRLVILQDTPWAPESIPDCLDLVGREQANSCDFTPLVRDSDLLGAERDGLDASGGFGVVRSLNGAVCPQNLCRAVQLDGTITYRDGHHFTATFSASLSPAVEELVITELSR